jgi:hypothetical protein
MNYSSSIVAFVSVAAGTYLPSRCSETALVYLPISPSLHSNGSTRYNMKSADFWDAMPRSSVDLLITLKKETESFSVTLIAFYQII